MKPVFTEFLLGFCGFLRLSEGDLTADSVSTTRSVTRLLFTAEDSDFLVVGSLIKPDEEVAVLAELNDLAFFLSA